MVDLINLEAIERLRYDKLEKDIEDYHIDWIKKNKCGCYSKFKGRRRDYILYRLKVCSHLNKAYIKKFDKEITRQFNTALKLGVIGMEKNLGRKLPALREAITKGVI